MTPRETLILARYVKACCPQQAMDEYTPDAWHDLLGDLSLADCKAAVQAAAKRQPFVAPAEIRAGVRRIIDERFERNPLPPPPPELLGDPAAYASHLRRSAQAIASGEPERAAIESAP